MKFCVNKIFLLSLAFGRGVHAKLITAKEGGIKDSYIVVLDEKATRRHLRGNDSFATSDLGISEFSASAVEGLAFQIANNAGVMGSFSLSNVYSNSLVGFAMVADEEVAGKIAEDKYVSYVEQNQVFKIDQQTGATWGIDRVDQRDLPLDSTYNAPRDGTGVAAYILDTGVQITHNEFGDRARWGANTSGDNQDRDCHGHGTHVAGTVGGLTYGVAKNVEIVAVKVLTCSGSGTTQGVINGVEWTAADAAAKGKPATANMSLGGGFSTALNTAVKALNNGGVPTVVAAGNDNGNACNKSPASEPDVITVGSTTITDARSSFSNYGTCLDIFAPGSSITAAWVGNDDATNTISGTSMASPHVCGGVALLLQEGVAADDIAEEIVGRATKNKVTNPQAGSPNELLFVGETGPTNAPTPAPPTPAPTPCISSTVTVEVTTDNYPAETAWKLTNNCSGDEEASRGLGSFPSSGTTYADEECVPAAQYTFTITDSYGDGICCNYGSGSYVVTYDGDVVKEGGSFGGSESITFGSCAPTDAPTHAPTDAPTHAPTDAPTHAPTHAPTANPTDAPTGGNDSPVSSPVFSPVSSPESSCIPCSDEETPGMKRSDKDCASLKTKALDKRCIKANWKKKKFCQLSCFLSDNGYDGDNCCVDGSA